MSTIVVCPNCKTEFEPTAAIAQSVRDDMAKEYNQKWVENSRQKEEQFKKEKEQLLKQQQEKEQQWQQQQQELSRKAEEEKKIVEAQLKKELEQKVGADFENKLKLLEEANKTNQAKLAEAREKEMDFLKKMQELQTREQEMELQMQRRLLDERNKLAEQVKKEEEEKNKLRETEHQFKVMELQKQLDDQRKNVEEMKRKIEQGSMQLQGEVQELALEELLRYSFVFDLVNEIGKGKKGADCILTVRNNFGQECGKIYFESKRTQSFGKDWIDKLKSDMRVLNVDIGVIVTQKMPDDMKCFGQRDGVWICQFSEVRAVVEMLRVMVITVFNATKSQEGVGDKKTLMYNYLISREFSEQWRAILEGYVAMRGSIHRERVQMEKMWKTRETQLNIVLQGLTNIKGSVEGISGSDVDLNLLTEGDGYLLE